MSLKKYSKKDHGIIKKDIDPDINIVAETLIASGYQAYLVGGCLRDMLLGKKPKDFDGSMILGLAAAYHFNDVYLGDAGKSKGFQE